VHGYTRIRKCKTEQGVSAAANQNPALGDNRECLTGMIWWQSIAVAVKLADDLVGRTDSS
jgi:hypothetical protein